MDDLLQEFIAETRETLEALSGEIVAWEAQPADGARLDAIFRFVHTVKGSCGFLDLPRLARLSHAAEDVLAAVRAGKRTPDTALVNAVLAIVDRIGELVEAIDSGASLDDQGEDLLIAALEERAAPVASVAVHSPNTPTVAKVASRSVRLGVDLLDRMMGGMSEMVLARNELARRLRDSGADPRVEIALERLSLTVADMRETVSQTRMQKIDALFSALPRMVRDTAAKLDKSIALVVDGADVELDREMVEVLRDPLAHIVRNAIDHGIETPAGRRAAGKREVGRLSVAARQSGNQILIEIADDGRGIDVDRLVAKYAAATGRSEAELRALPERARLELIFAPGLSSRDEATDISGRGVGMDVVRANVEQVSGRVDLASTPGRGTTLTIRVPLTLSIISTIIVGSGEHRFALPRQAVEEIVTLANPAIRVDLLGDAEVATIREERMPLVQLASALGDRGAPRMLVVLSVSGGRYALAVDTVFDTEELVVKPAAPAVMAAGLYAGQTLPDTGRPMLLLDVAGIAAAHALHFDEALPKEESVEVVEDTLEALLFDDLDGQRRAIALAALDRVEVARADDVAYSAGRLRLTVGDRTVPLLACADPAPGRDVTVLRLNDGETDLGYAVAEPLSIVAVPRAFTPAAAPGRIAGVMVLGGEQVEMIDTHWLFAHEHDAGSVARPTCLILPEASGWMQTFLRPLLEAAGHRVATSLDEADPPAVALVLDDAPPPGSALPIIRLSRSRSGAGIYRYDREAVIAAVARHVERIAA